MSRRWTLSRKWYEAYLGPLFPSFCPYQYYYSLHFYSLDDRAAISPLLLAAITAYFLSPVVSFFHDQVRLPRKVAANLVFFLVLALILALPFTILPGQYDDIQAIVKDMNVALDKIQVLLAVPRQIGGVRFDFSTLLPSLRSNLGTEIVPKPQDALNVILIGSRNLLWTLVILVSTYFLMTDWERLRNWLIGIAPPQEQPDLHRLYEEIRKVWLGYLGGQIRLMLVLALIYAAAWGLVGLPGAIILGILAGVLNLLPEIGPAAAALLAVVVALLEGSTWLPVSNLWFAAITLGIYLLLNNFKTIWLQPRILGQSVRLHEGVVFIAIVLAIMLGGALLVLLVVPLLATAGVVGRYIRHRMLGEPPFPDTSLEQIIPPPPSETEEPISTEGNLRNPGI